MTVYRAKKCLRDYLISSDDAARLLKVSGYRFRQLVRDGFIQAESRKGFFRLGNVLDGYVRAKTVAAAQGALADMKAAA